MLNNLWSLALICSIGSICIVLGTILKISNIFQLILLLGGLITCCAGILGLIKLLLGKNNK